VLKDELIVLKGHYARQDYPGMLRRVTAKVELDGQERTLVFLTNNLEWSGGSVADLYRCRWQIEVFFKQVKQTLQLADFFGQSANAVKWQVWMAFLVYVLVGHKLLGNGVSIFNEDKHDSAFGTDLASSEAEMRTRLPRCSVSATFAKRFQQMACSEFRTIFLTH
jgi:Transposase DDE domain